MFCTACAAANPRSLARCSACGAPLRRGRDGARRPRGRAWTARLHRRPGRRAAGGDAPGGRRLLAGGAGGAGGGLRPRRARPGRRRPRGGDRRLRRRRRPPRRPPRCSPPPGPTWRPSRALYQAGIAALGAGNVEGAIAACSRWCGPSPVTGTRRLPGAGAGPTGRRRWQDPGARRPAGRLAGGRAGAALRWSSSTPATPSVPPNSPTSAAITSPSSSVAPARSPWSAPDGEDERTVDRRRAGRLARLESGPDPDRLRLAGRRRDCWRSTSSIVDGSGLTRLAEWLRPYEPSVWSPDGTRIAFLSTRRSSRCGRKRQRPRSTWRPRPRRSANRWCPCRRRHRGSSRSRPGS